MFRTDRILMEIRTWEKEVSTFVVWSRLCPDGLFIRDIQRLRSVLIPVKISYYMKVKF